MTPDDLRQIADQYPLRVARDMAAGIVALAATAATEAEGTTHEAAVRDVVQRIVEAAGELRVIGGLAE